MAVVGIGLDDLIDLTNRCAISASANVKKRENHSGSAIRISNAPPGVSSNEILDLFNFGVITALKMSPSSAEVEVRYADAEAAREAAECFDGVCLFERGTPIRVEVIEEKKVDVGDFLSRSSRCSLCGSGSSSGSARSLESARGVKQRVTREQLDEEMDEYMREGERRRLGKKKGN